MSEEASDRERLLWWLGVGVIGVCFVIFAEINSLLVAIESSGQHSFGTGVLTGPKLEFWDLGDIGAAIQLWFSGLHADLAARLVVTHTFVDFFFIAAYAFLLHRALTRLEVETKTAAALVGFLVLTDSVETVTTLVMVGFLEYDGPALMVIQVFSLLKWIGVIVAVIALVARWRSKRAAAVGKNTKSQNGEQSLGPAVGALTVIAILFAALVALPAGGALEQLPDVIRFQFTEAAVWNRVLAVFSLSLFVVAMAAAGHIATEAPRRRRSLVWWAPILVAGGLSVALVIASSLLNGRFTPGPMAPLLVVGGLWVIAELVAVFQRAAASEQPVSAPKPAIAESAHVKLVGGDEAKSRRVGVLAGTVAVVGALGLVRATAGNLLLGTDGFSVRGDFAAVLLFIVTTAAALVAVPRSSLTLPAVIIGGIGGLTLIMGALGFGNIWWLASLGVATALLAGSAAESLVVASRADSRVRSRLVRALVPGSVLLVGAAALVLVTQASRGRGPGTTGVIAIGLAFFALFAALLGWFSRKYGPWAPTKQLGFGPRPPWGTILVVSWIVASFLTDNAGYHDARVEEADLSLPDRYATLTASVGDEDTSAFDRWLSQQADCAVMIEAGVGSAQSVYPMVLVAAPGGGIRAAYWTTNVLESHFGAELDPCAQNRLFAVSGVSGGSVGAVTWLAAHEQGLNPVAAVSGMARDDGLAAAAVGLFRDMFQPFLGFDTIWADRGQLLEDGWARSAIASPTEGEGEPRCVFRAEAGEPSADTAKCDGNDGRRMWSSFGEQSDAWVPLLMLNGSSVTDGCRVIVANVDGLPSVDSADCFASSAIGGPASGTIDATDRLLVPGANCPAASGDVPLVTAALLSARFPVVSPSGALHNCYDSGETAVEHVTYTVDGGYYENSGLFSLLQIWSEIEPEVKAHNARVATGEAEGFIEPWIILASNGYRSSAKSDAPGRPRELLLPITTLGNVSAVFGEAAFQQMADTALTSFKAEPCGGAPECFEPRSSVVRVSPTREPSVAAPLGWVLSADTRSDLDRELEQALELAAVRVMRQALGL